MYLTRLYFGRKTPTGGDVSAADWSKFESGYLVTWFADGYTVMAAEGGWRDAATGEHIKENTTIVEIVHDGSRAEDIRSLAHAYKNRFEQDAVMVITTLVDVKFL